jgi:hypothetical protein
MEEKKAERNKDHVFCRIIISSRTAPGPRVIICLFLVETKHRAHVRESRNRNERN